VLEDRRLSRGGEDDDRSRELMQQFSVSHYVVLVGLHIFFVNKVYYNFLSKYDRFRELHSDTNLTRGRNPLLRFYPEPAPSNENFWVRPLVQAMYIAKNDITDDLETAAGHFRYYKRFRCLILKNTTYCIKKLITTTGRHVRIIYTVVFLRR